KVGRLIRGNDAVEHQRDRAGEGERPRAAVSPVLPHQPAAPNLAEAGDPEQKHRLGEWLHGVMIISRAGSMNTVLFACVHNASRSQMAAALFNQLADPTKARAISAGTQPGTRVHPE